MVALVRAGVLAVAVVTLSAGVVLADTYTVEPDESGDYPNIQAAVDAASDGDIILLGDGTFTGDGNRDIQVPSKAITIKSASTDYNACIIDCGGSAREEHRAFRFHSGAGTGNATLQSVGIINGYATDAGGGGGIITDGADPNILSCAVAMCTAAGPSARGGGLYVMDGSDPDVYFCVFAENTAEYGGGVAIVGSEAVFNSCDVTDNVATHSGGGVYAQGAAQVQFTYSNIVSNTAPRAGGVRTAGSSIFFQHCNISRNEATAGHSGGVWLQGGFLNYCTIVENSATEGGGGVHCDAGTGGLNGCLIAFTEDGYGVAASSGNAPSLDCCDVWDNADGNYDAEVGDQTGLNDNFSLDPELCDIENADYRLFETSPCLGTESPCGIQVGRYGQGCDSPVEGTSWGRVKALYR